MIAFLKKFPKKFIILYKIAVFQEEKRWSFVPGKSLFFLSLDFHKHFRKLVYLF
jgi:hypothetical protein